MLIVLAENAVPMQTLSEAIGSTCVSQLLTLVHWLSPARPVQLILPLQDCWAERPEMTASTPPPEDPLSAERPTSALVRTLARGLAPASGIAPAGRGSARASGKSADVVAPPR